MKPVSLLLRGIVVSSIAVAVGIAAQERPQHWAPKGHATTIEAAQHANQQPKEFTPPAPRGDLRGDIASNARVRPEPVRPPPQARNNNPQRR